MRFEISVFPPIALASLRLGRECLLLAVDHGFRIFLGQMKYIMHLPQLCQPLNIIQWMHGNCHLSYCVALQFGKNFLIAFRERWNFPRFLFGLWSSGRLTLLKIQHPIHLVWISYATIGEAMGAHYLIFLKTR